MESLNLRPAPPRQYATYASHNMIPKPLWDDFVKASCVLSPSANASERD